MIHISVIIPVFNTDAYVAQCIQSVLGQEFDNFEVIIVDDCSSDDSVQIIESLCRKNPGIRLLKQGVNLGAGAARNRGLNEAAGEYILFLDSDDYCVAPHNLEHLYHRAEETGADIVLYKHSILDIETGNTSDMLSDDEKRCWAYIEKEIDCTRGHTLEKFYDLLIAPAYPWNKLIKRSLLIDKNIRCTETFCHNDLALSWKSMMSGRVFGLLPETIVVHRHAPTLTQLTNDKSKRRLDLFKALDEVNLFFQEKKIPATPWFYYLKFKWDCFFWGMIHISPPFRPAFIRLMKKDLLASPPDIRAAYFRDFVQGMREKLKILLLQYSPPLFTILFHIFRKKRNVE